MRAKEGCSVVCVEASHVTLSRHRGPMALQSVEDKKHILFFYLLLFLTYQQKVQK